MPSPAFLPAKAENEAPVPLIWRPVLTQIIDRLVAKDYTLALRPGDVCPIGEPLATFIADQIAAYGDELTSLLEESWDRAVYMWMGEHWDVVVDLSMKRQGVGDLALFAKIYERGDGFLFEVASVYVP